MRSSENIGIGDLSVEDNEGFSVRDFLTKRRSRLDGFWCLCPVSDDRNGDVDWPVGENNTSVDPVARVIGAKVERRFLPFLQHRGYNVRLNFLRWSLSCIRYLHGHRNNFVFQRNIT